MSARPDHQPPQLTRLANGNAQLYFPPLRRPLRAIVIGLFGAACLAAGTFSAMAVLPLAATGPAGVLSIWLMSAFIVPILVFGAVFPLQAIHALVNSLTVIVAPDEIRTVRRILGVPCSEHRIACARIGQLLAVEEPLYFWDRNRRYRLIACSAEPELTLAKAMREGKLRAWRNRRVVIAEDLAGEEALRLTRAEVLRSARLDRLDRPQWNTTG